MWFRAHYNQVRPHPALNRKTPADAYVARPKATPSGPTVEAPFRLRRDRIDGAGALILRHDSKLHHIEVGRLFAGTRLLMLVAALDVRIVNEDGEPLRSLTIDSSTGSVT